MTTPSDARALLVTEIFPPKTGGSGRWFWELYRRLPTCDVCVVAPEHPGAAVFDRDAPMRIERIPLRSASWGVLRPA